MFLSWIRPQFGQPEPLISSHLLAEADGMNIPRLLRESLLPGRAARPAGDGIWSVLPEGHGSGSGSARYDRRAAAYDRVVGSALYNRLAWGASAAHYRAFAARAVGAGFGPLLDAGSGSAVFTAAAYAHAGRPLVLVDRSLGMLAAARDRLARAAGGRPPAHVVLLQADLLDLPFRPGCFETVLSMGMLHLFKDAGAAALLRGLVANLTVGGGLFLTSLVAERAVGRCYLAMLHRAGEVATPRRVERLGSLLRAELGEAVECQREGSMAYVVAQAAEVS
jgi:SAM-dependent methyltransferase